MGYAIMRTVKMKSDKAIMDRYHHDYRIFNVANADPLKENEYDLTGNANGRSYLDLYEDTVREMHILGAMKKQPRRDAVKGIDVFLSFSHEDAERMSLEEWTRENIAWLRRSFNPPGGKIHYTDPETGEEKEAEIDNVKSAVLHLDESTPHIHAWVVPIDDRGRLSAYYYMKDRDAMCDRQDDYAAAMEQFGLTRGERHSVATHEQSSRYYNKLLEAVEAELPSPLPGESIDDYHTRANEFYQTEMVHHRDELRRKDQEIIRIRSGVYDDRADVISREQELAALENRVNRQSEKLLNISGEDELTDASVRNISRKLRAQTRFETALEEYPDRIKAEQARRNYQEMIDWQRRREERVAREIFTKKGR